MKKWLIDIKKTVLFFFSFYYLLSFCYGAADMTIIVPVDTAGQPRGDTYLDESNPSTKYYQYSNLLAFMDSSYYRQQIMLGFDVSSIPTDTQINEAKLRMYAGVIYGGGTTIYLKPRGGTWSVTDADWNTYGWNITGDSSWTPASVTSTGWNSWDITSIVKGWVSSPSSNYGLHIGAKSDTGEAVKGAWFYSRQYSIDYAPRIYVTLKPLITSISPSSGKFNDLITINGKYFGSSSGQVTFYNGKTATINSWSDTQIKCYVPSGAASGNVTVTQYGTSNGIYFTVLPDLTIYSGPTRVENYPFYYGPNGKYPACVTFNTKVKNIGDGSSPSSKLGYYLDGSDYLDYDSVSSLGPGGISSESECLDIYGNGYGWHYLSVKADYDNAVTESNEGNNWDYSSDFEIRYDNTPPSGNPTITSSSHPDQNIWYSTRNIIFNWQPCSDSDSGMQGYSYILDNSPTTVPDTSIETTGTSASYSNKESGIWYFHVRPIDNVNNGGNTQHYTVHIDTIAPNNPTTCSAWKTSAKTISISSGVWQSETANPYFEWSGASDTGGSGLKGYYYYYGTSATGEPSTWTTNNYYDAGDDPGNSGVYYLRIKTEDNAGNISISSTIFVVKYDGPPTITDLSAKTDSGGTPISQNTWQTDNDPYFYWTEPVSASLIEGYSWAWDLQPDTIADTPPGTNTYYQTPNDSLTNGQHTFYIKAKNNVGWGPVASFNIWVDSSLPTLSWTGEPNYSSNGVYPLSDRPDTNFVFRVKYEDADNDAPASGYPKLHIKKGGVEIFGSPFTMTEVDSGDTNYADGKLYTYSTTLSSGTDYTYRFEANNVIGALASGSPTSWTDAPDVYDHNAPILSWTGEPNYSSNGIYPSTGRPDTNFVFRISYSDADNDAPASGYPKLHIKKGAVDISYTMIEADPGDTNYIDGKIYTYQTTLAAGIDYTYRFEANNVIGASANGSPTLWTDAPDVYEHNAPVLSWTGEPNYGSDGVDPGMGDINTNFTFRVKYTDGNNDPPKTGYPIVRLKRGETEKTFQMNPVDPGDVIYSDGKLYTLSTTLEGGIYSYRFEAFDSYDIQSVGEATMFNNGPTVVGGASEKEMKIYHSVLKPGQAEKTYISFNPSSTGQTTVKVYDTAGRKVRTLFEGTSAPGLNTLQWDGKDDAGNLVSSGVYFIRIEAPGIKQQKKVVVIR